MAVEKSTNEKHILKSRMLVKLRKDAGLTQDELAARIDISRETISGLENCHIQQMTALTADTEDSWWEVCRGSATPDTFKLFKAYLQKKLGPFKF